MPGGGGACFETGGLAVASLSLACCRGFGELSSLGMMPFSHSTLNYVRRRVDKSGFPWKGFVDAAEADQACCAKPQALSASGRIISALAGANSLVAVPSRTRPMMPCRMAAMRKKL